MAQLIYFRILLVIFVFTIYYLSISLATVERDAASDIDTQLQQPNLLLLNKGCSKGSEKQSRNRNPTPSIQKQVSFLEGLVPPLMAALVALSPIYSNPPVSLGQTIDIQRGAKLFGHACIGCHDGGGNIIQPGATLFLKDLQRNGVDSTEEIFRVTYYGKERMPGFGESCTPRGQCTFGARLRDEEIKLLADFVKSQADQGWANIASTED